ncbi:MAG: CRTAC1 family protein [Acidimicrobiia bacterium]|nr:CRTAC1 family protein [Acidimicrobiia bacterium]
MTVRSRSVAAVVVLLVAACSGGEADPPSATPTSDGSAAESPDALSTAPPPTGSTGIGDDMTCWTAPAASGAAGITLVDATADWGLVDPLTGMYGHAAAWGDVDGDGFPDLAVGTFANRDPARYQERGADGPSPDRLLLATGDGYQVAAGFPEEFGRTSGSAFVDLDGDGDLDLVLSRNVSDRDAGLAATTVFANEDGRFTAVTDSGLDPALPGRSIGVLDVDQDGLLDLVIVEDRYTGGSSRAYRNLGDLRFEDATESWGMPLDVAGLGIATGDLNGDRSTDFFVAGSNRLFVGTGSGVTEVTSNDLVWPPAGPEDDAAGAAIADINRDGWPDLVVGHHYNSTLSQGTPAPIRLYLNRTAAAGDEPVLDEVTEEAGLVALPTKAPHVEIVDLDNDGWPDILTTASAGDGATPAVFRSTGVDGGIPRFESPTGLGSAQYWVAGPTADIDHDGRLDALLVEWEPALPSLLMVNQSASGHWLQVSVGPELGGGVGTTVAVYEAGGAGDLDRLVGIREIVATVGYTAGIEQIAHLGLGDATEVDVVVTPPPGHDPITLTGVAADQHLRLPNGC